MHDYKGGCTQHCPKCQEHDEGFIPFDRNDPKNKYDTLYGMLFPISVILGLFALVLIPRFFN